jgi:DNA-binding NarL/FixJ family response regulator
MERLALDNEKTTVLLAGEPYERMERLAVRLNMHTSYKAVIPQQSAEQQIISLIAHTLPHIVLFDFPDGERGISMLNEITRLFSGVRPVALSDCADIKVAFSVVGSGGWGYLLKRCTDDEIFAAILRVASGEKSFCPALGWEMLSSINAFSPPFPSSSLAKLPHHLRKILPDIRDGKTSKEIADKFFISPKSARLYRQMIMEALEVHNVAELQRQLMTSMID